jgi:sugar phosphate isomerase/epimerase
VSGGGRWYRTCEGGPAVGPDECEQEGGGGPSRRAGRTGVGVAGLVEIGINLEFVRHEDRSFEYAVEAAARLGYRYIEPCVLDGRDLLAEAGYYHFRSLDDDPREIGKVVQRHGLRISGLSAHSPLMKPEVAVGYLRKAIRWASDLGVNVVNTDEGVKPEWMTDEQAFAIMEYTLHQVLITAENYGVYVALEPHGVYTTTLAGMRRILALSDSPYLRVNYDTGNSFLAGAEDPYEMLEALAPKVVHVHAKDIGGALLDQRGKVTGTPVGVACGDGVVDWHRVVRILRDAGYRGVLSVECGTEEQAERSLAYLRRVLAEQGLAAADG